VGNEILIVTQDFPVPLTDLAKDFLGCQALVWALHCFDQALVDCEKFASPRSLKNNRVRVSSPPDSANFPIKRIARASRLYRCSTIWRWGTTSLGSHSCSKVCGLK
jgi:hypothetical protein